MPLNLTNTIRLLNIPPNLINFNHDSKFNNKMSVCIYFSNLQFNPSHFSSCHHSKVTLSPPLLAALLASSSFDDWLLRQGISMHFHKPFQKSLQLSVKTFL